MYKFLIWVAVLLMHPAVAVLQNIPDGYRLERVLYNRNDTVDVLIKSARGEENSKKPVLFFCQGSLPIPLVLFNEEGHYGIFPFSVDSLEKKYHLLIAGKPGVPLIQHTALLQPDFTYVGANGVFPDKYLQNNLPDYYIERNNFLLRYFLKKSWVSSKMVVVAGHSEGSYIAARMAASNKKITHIIYSGGNVLGRIMVILEASRKHEVYADSSTFSDGLFDYWKEILKQKESMDASQGDTYKAMYEFSQPVMDVLLKLKIPVLVSYGTADHAAPFNDYLQVECIRKKNEFISFYVLNGTEHNYFPVDENGKVNYSVFNWDKVALAWHDWLLKKP